MKLVTYISSLVIPITILIIVLYGARKKIDLYGTFAAGAKEGLIISKDMLPTLIGLFLAVTVLRESGALEAMSGILAKLIGRDGFPAELLPLTLMRLFSSSAASSLQVDLYANYGPDSFIGRLASVMMSCTETVFYTMAIYFMSVKIKKTRYTLAGALLANLAGIIASYYIVLLFFGRE
ncbi:MAG: spore maturation protein [Firmicutes bacterium]|nr:spore maturation protein [Bacillota bacterium]